MLWHVFPPLTRAKAIPLSQPLPSSSLTQDDGDGGVAEGTVGVGGERTVGIGGGGTVGVGGALGGVVLGGEVLLDRCLLVDSDLEEMDQQR